MTRLTTTSVLTVRTVTEGVRGLTACTRKISSTGSSLSVPGTSTHVAQTTWTHRVRKPPSPRGSCPPAPALTPPPSCAHAGPARPPGPGSDAGSPRGLPSSSGAAARRSPPENRSPLRLPRDLLFECRPRQTQSPASCAIGTGGLTRRGQRAGPDEVRWARRGRTRVGTAQGGRAQSPWATSRRQPTPARPPRLEAGGMGLSPGPATGYLGRSLLSLNLLILKKDMN